MHDTYPIVVVDPSHKRRGPVGARADEHSGTMAVTYVLHPWQEPVWNHRVYILHADRLQWSAADLAAWLAWRAKAQTVTVVWGDRRCDMRVEMVSDTEVTLLPMCIVMPGGAPVASTAAAAADTVMQGAASAASSMSAASAASSMSAAPEPPLDDNRAFVVGAAPGSAGAAAGGARASPPRHSRPPRMYKGVAMRSMLEMRHAAFLDSLGASWKYEPMTLDIGQGARYTPDFLVRASPVDVILEIKPAIPMGTEQQKAMRASLVQQLPVVILYGEVGIGYQASRTRKDGPPSYDHRDNMRGIVYVQGKRMPFDFYWMWDDKAKGLTFTRKDIAGDPVVEAAIWHPRIQEAVKYALQVVPLRRRRRAIA